jgi:hypothetical protein
MAVRVIPGKGKHPDTWLPGCADACSYRVRTLDGLQIHVSRQGPPISTTGLEPQEWS